MDLQNKIRRGEIDPNNQALFFSSIYKGLIYELNQCISLRGEYIPHFILNTGDDIMYLEVKGQDHSVEPLQVSNENYVYNKTPRAILTVGNIEVLSDQLTNPYTNGNFDMEYEGNVYGFHAEFRRIPLKTSVTVKYYLDNFTDVLDVSQQLISKLMFVKNYRISYMGHTIFCTYKPPTSIDKDMNISFDGGTTDSKLRTIEMEIEIETNYPLFEPKTVILNSNYFSSTLGNIKLYPHHGIEEKQNHTDEEYYSGNGSEDTAYDRYVKTLEVIVKDARQAKNILNELLEVEGKEPQKTIYQSAEKVIDLQDEAVQLLKELDGPWNQALPGSENSPST